MRTICTRQCAGIFAGGARLSGGCGAACGTALALRRSPARRGPASPPPPPAPEADLPGTTTALVDRGIGKLQANQILARRGSGCGAEEQESTLPIMVASSSVSRGDRFSVALGPLALLPAVCFQSPR